MSNDELVTRARAERRQRGWTQRELADKANVSLRTIQMFESGKTAPQPANQRAILAALGLAPDDVGEATAAATRASWPDHIQVYLDVIGAYVSTFPTEEEQREYIYNDTRAIFARLSERLS